MLGDCHALQGLQICHVLGNRLVLSEAEQYFGKILPININDIFSFWDISRGELRISEQFRQQIIIFPSFFCQFSVVAYSATILYLPVYNAHPCIMRTPILDYTLKKKKKKRKQKTEEVVKKE